MISTKAPGAGRPEKHYDKLTLRMPPAAVEAIRAACREGETLGECVARKFRPAAKRARLLPTNPRPGPAGFHPSGSKPRNRPA